MASEKMINGRLQLKHDTEANWNLAAEKSNFTPKIAEPIVYDADETHDYIRFKIGDGARNVKDLPFIIDNVELITLAEIDAICGTSITVVDATIETF